MSEPLDANRLKALRSMALLPELRPLLDLIALRLNEADLACRHATGEEVYRFQGRALALEALLEDITEADTRLRVKERSTPPQRPPAYAGYRG